LNIRTIELEGAAVTDRGRRRPLNEDSYAYHPEVGLFVVADGMGGENAGEVASQMVIHHFTEGLLPFLVDEEATFPFDAVESGDWLLNAMKHTTENANQRILDDAAENTEHKGMGTTLTGVIVHDQRLFVAHVGDSRLYQWDNPGIRQISEDHTKVQEMVNREIITADLARTHPQRHVLTRCMGRKKKVRIDLFSMDFSPSSVYLLCTDGLYDLITDERIDSLIRSCPTLEETASTLVSQANAAGGKDNITLILFRQKEMTAEDPTTV